MVDNIDITVTTLEDIERMTPSQRENLRTATMGAALEESTHPYTNTGHSAHRATVEKMQRLFELKQQVKIESPENEPDKETTIEQG